MSKTVNTLHILSKIGKIFSIIFSICCIIGAVGCFIGGIVLLAVPQDFVNVTSTTVTTTIVDFNTLGASAAQEIMNNSEQILSNFAADKATLEDGVLTVTNSSNGIVINSLGAVGGLCFFETVFLGGLATAFLFIKGFFKTIENDAVIFTEANLKKGLIAFSVYLGVVIVGGIINSIISSKIVSSSSTTVSLSVNLVQIFAYLCIYFLFKLGVEVTKKNDTSDQNTTSYLQ